jgi:pilus assembly protein Flp/PilA
VLDRTKTGGKFMTSFAMRFLKDTKGATAIEYGLIASLISVAIIAAAKSLGGNVSATFNKVAGNMSK